MTSSAARWSGRITREGFKTHVLNNGSKWNGQPPDPIEKLLERLNTHALDREFETLGGFRHLENGSVHYFGNFHTISAVFNIVTNDLKLIRLLDDAINKNMASPEYQSQPH